MFYFQLTTICFYMSGLPFKKQVLEFKNKKLEDGKTLMDYKITENSTIVLRLAGELRIYLKFLNGKTITFVIKGSEKTESLKDKIKQKERKCYKLLYVILEVSITVLFM